MTDTRYRRNAGSVYSQKYHLVWCPKYRRKVLVGEIAEDLRSLLYQKAQELEVTIEALEIMPDHVHLFIQSDPTEALTSCQPIQRVHFSDTAPNVPSVTFSVAKYVEQELLHRYNRPGFRRNRQRVYRNAEIKLGYASHLQVPPSPLSRAGCKAGLFALAISPGLQCCPRTADYQLAGSRPGE